MRKIYLLLAALSCTFFAWAQTTPSVSFSFTVSVSTFNVSFVNTSQNLGDGVKKAFWSFGDGVTTATGPLDGTVHLFPSAGTYQACLKIYRYPANSHDSTLIGSECKSVVIAKPNVADSCAAYYTAQPTTASPLGRKFIAHTWNNHQKKPLRICWTFGDGKDSCIEYTTAYTGDYWVEHKYAQYGQYEVCVTVKYDGGCESHYCGKVNIEQLTPPAVCEVSVNEAATNVANAERRFYAGLQANRVSEKICWTFGDGTDTCIVLSSPLNPQQLMVTHRYMAPGNYTVCVKATYAGGCVAERCKPVEIRMPQSNVCGGYFTDSVVTAATIRFKANGIQSPNDYVTSYVWTFGDGTAATGQQVTHSYAGPGTYNVLLVMKTNNGCETRISKHMVIAGDVKPQLVLTPNPVINSLTAVFQSLFQQTLSVRIYNGNGLLLKTYTRNAVQGTNNWTFDASGLQTGVYTMIVQSSNQFATAIFFKQ